MWKEILYEVPVIFAQKTDSGIFFLLNRANIYAVKKIQSLN